MSWKLILQFTLIAPVILITLNPTKALVEKPQQNEFVVSREPVDEHLYKFKIPRVQERAGDNGLNIQWKNAKGLHVLGGHLGVSLPKAVGQPVACPTSTTSNGGQESKNSEYCLDYGDYAQLKIHINGTEGCSRIEWSSPFASRLEDCLDLESGVHWYGGAETYIQKWPIEGEARPEVPYVSGDVLSGQREYGSVTENYWVISSGVTLHVDEDVPLFISWKTVHPGQVCFVAKPIHPYTPRSNLTLSYDVCVGDDPKTRHLQSIIKFYPRPKTIPDKIMMIKPFWSTWVQYKTQVNQSLVLDFARELKAQGLAEDVSSHIELDDDWETCYGEAKFNLTKFPDVGGMVKKLKAMGFRITLWVHPFMNMDCPSYKHVMENRYFVQDSYFKPGITSWWNGKYSSLFDFTNPEAVEWWKCRLDILKNIYDIDSFKFDAGEIGWLPYSVNLSGDPLTSPSHFTTKYIETVASFGPMVEVRTGRRNQNQAIFTRMFDKDSKWGYNNGLKTLIPTLLQLSILGYSFVLPDIIGGNVYGDDKPTPELFIRWIQANALMPAIQFSILPWTYEGDDQIVLNVTKGILALREKYQDLIHKAALQTISDGSPINRPMWWVDPSDPVTFTIDSQYMLGDEILVAPVLEEGAVTRDIYLPQGVWLEPSSGGVHEGPTWLKNYSAPLTVLPYFIKEKEIESSPCDALEPNYDDPECPYSHQEEKNTRPLIVSPNEM